MSTSPSTLPDLLARALRDDPSRPQVTFYDDATGERVELSVVTFANWVAKTAGLVQDELGLEGGELALVDLPTHWLTPVWLQALWTVGLPVTTDPDEAGAASLVVCGPDALDRYAALAPATAVVALSLRPLGARFADPLPEGVLDYGAEVLGQPDAFTPLDPPGADTPAWQQHGRALSHADLVAEAQRDGVVATSGRLLTDLDPASPEGWVTLLAPLARSAGTVWVRHPDPAGWGRHAEQERVTDVLGGPAVSR